jgi:sec-independent protein translocase protein TatA
MTVIPVLGEIVGWEFLLVLAVAALLFGSSQLPKLARSVGQASKEFRKGIEEGAGDDEEPESKPKAEIPATPESPAPPEKPADPPNPANPA